METIKARLSALLRFSLIESPPKQPEQHYVDDEDDQRQGFLEPKGQELDSTSAATTRTRSMSIHLKRAIVACAVILIGAGSFLLGRSSTTIPSSYFDRDESDHAIQVLSSLVSTTEPAKFRMESPCGSTAKEAQARGCTFDPISFCWLPDECYDSELVATFEATRTWELYADEAGKVPVSQEQLMSGYGDGLWVTWEYHLRHCAFMWVKLHRGILNREKPGMPEIDSYIASLNHTHHCTTILLTDRDVGFNALNTETLVKYPHCGMI